MKAALLLVAARGLKICVEYSLFRIINCAIHKKSDFFNWKSELDHLLAVNEWLRLIEILLEFLKSGSRGKANILISYERLSPWHKLPNSLVTAV